MSHSERPAIFVSFEGIDGCGKSTLLAQLSIWLEAADVPHIRTREPGGTSLGEAARSIVLDTAHFTMHPWAEALFYASARAQHVFEVILPALRRGEWVLSDRFADATLAYQGYGRGLNLKNLCDVHQWSTGNVWPDLTVLLDCPVEAALKRREHRPDGPDRLERQDRSFHERVRTGYLELARAQPGRFLTLDADRPLKEVVEHLHRLLSKRPELRFLAQL